MSPTRVLVHTIAAAVMASTGSVLTLFHPFDSQTAFVARCALLVLQLINLGFLARAVHLNRRQH
jgi:hypothetical protein